MKPRLSDIASLAEIIASVGVIISIVFLALEVSENNRQTQAATAQLINQNEREMVTVFIEYAGTWDKVVTGSPISPGEEMRRAINLYQMSMLDAANRYRQFKEGYITKETWDGQLATLPDMKQLPIYKEWRSSFGGQSQDTQFLEYIDSLPGGDGETE